MGLHIKAEISCDAARCKEVILLDEWEDDACKTEAECEGWKELPDGSWLCPECAAKQEAK